MRTKRLQKDAPGFVKLFVLRGAWFGQTSGAAGAERGQPRAQRKDVVLRRAELEALQQAWVEAPLLGVLLPVQQRTVHLRMPRNQPVIQMIHQLTAAGNRAG